MLVHCTTMNVAIKDVLDAPNDDEHNSWENIFSQTQFSLPKSLQAASKLLELVLENKAC